MLEINLQKYLLLQKTPHNLIEDDKSFLTKTEKEEKAKKRKDKKKSKASNKKVCSCTQECPNSKSTSTVETNNKSNCKFGTVLIEKEKRKFVLQLNDPLKLVERKPILEIIGGNRLNPAKLTVTLNSLNGPCEQHSKRIIDLKGQKQTHNEKLEFKAYSNAISFIDKNIIPWNPKVNTYQLALNSCEKKGLYADVIVYPDLELSYSIKFGFVYSNKTRWKDSETQQLIFPESEKTESWVLELYGEWKEDGVKENLELKFQENIRKVYELTNVMGWITSNLKKLSDHAKIVSGTEFQILPLHLSHSGKFAWKEVEGKAYCDKEYCFELGMDPLFGVGVTLDILGMSLLMVPGIGPLIKRSKDLLELASNGKIAITLSIEGNINGLVKAEKKAGFDTVTSNGEIGGKIKIELKGICSSKKDYFKVSASWEISPGGVCAIEVKIKSPQMDEKNRSYIDLIGSSTGIKFYLVANVRIGLKEDDDIDPFGVKTSSEYKREYTIESEEPLLKQDEHSIHKFIF